MQENTRERRKKREKADDREKAKRESRDESEKIGHPIDRGSDAD
jgi:hypothetical protein